MDKRGASTLRWTGFLSIVLGGATVSFGPTQKIKIIGGLIIAVGSAVASLA